jgi:hypothetical protein
MGSVFLVCWREATGLDSCLIVFDGVFLREVIGGRRGDCVVETDRSVWVCGND